MREYVEILVPGDLLPQVVGELLVFAVDPNDVDVVHGSVGRVIHVHPEIAEAWFQARNNLEKVPASETEPELVPVETAPEPPASTPEPPPAPVTTSEVPNSPAPRKRSTPSA